jgi:hypothetical protein
MVKGGMRRTVLPMTALERAFALVLPALALALAPRAEAAPGAPAPPPGPVRAGAPPPGLDPGSVPAQPSPAPIPVPVPLPEATEGAAGGPATSASPTVALEAETAAAAAPGTGGPPTTPMRPRLTCAIGVGTSLDHSGTSDGRTVPIPAFEFSVGAGGEAFGFEANLMSTQASGRYRKVTNGVDDIGVDRAAVDLLLAVRPAWLLGRPPVRDGAVVLSATRRSYLGRVWRSFTIDLGGVAERVAPGVQSAYRFGGVVAGHLDILPLTPADQPSAIAVRIGARRVLAPRKLVSTTETTDTTLDAFVGLAAVF